MGESGSECYISPERISALGLNTALRTKLSQTVDAMADDTFQNQIGLDDAIYLPYLDQAMTFNSGINNMVGQPVDATQNQFWLDSTTWDACFDGQMALNFPVDDTTANDAPDNVWSSSVACESYLDEEMTPNAVGDETVHDSGYINFDSYIDGPLNIDLATGSMEGGIFDIDYMTGDSHLDEPETKEFERWKESWKEKMLLISWKREGKEWNDIAKGFRKMGTSKRIGGWKTTFRRASSEVSLLSLFEGLKTDLW